MRTILIVENNRRDRQHTRAIIQKTKVQFDTILECASYEDALFIIKHQKIDIMCTDINMDGVDGILYIEEMQKMKHKPQIIVISGGNKFAQAVRLLRLGVRDYLLKPVQPKQLEEIIVKLDQELTLGQKNLDNFSAVNGQYLKQMLLRGSINQGELEAIERQSEVELFSQKYVVCCLDNMGLKSYMIQDRAYLGNVLQSEIYIIKEEILENIRMQEWRRRYVGVSKTYTGIKHLQQAYEEAKIARVEAFYTSKAMLFYDNTSIQNTTITGKIKEQDIASQVSKLSTKKADTAIKFIRNLIWNNTRTKNRQELETIITELFLNLEESYPHIYKKEEYEIQNLKSPFSYANIVSYEFEFISWLEKFIEKVQVQMDDFKSKEKIERAIQYIQNNYSKDFNMAVVSNEVSMNYTLFSLAFKEFTGVNFVSYLKEIRMKKAKEYLGKTDKKIAEISASVGYENEKHFMKTFKALYGVSPTEYRKSLQLK